MTTTTTTPSPAQVREAAAAGRAHGETGTGEWNPYQGLLSQVWLAAQQDAAGQPTRAETATKFAELGIELV